MGKWASGLVDQVAQVGLEPTSGSLAQTCVRCARTRVGLLSKTFAVFTDTCCYLSEKSVSRRYVGQMLVDVCVWLFLLRLSCLSVLPAFVAFADASALHHYLSEKTGFIQYFGQITICP